MKPIRLGIRRVLLNDSSQSRWTTRTVYKDGTGFIVKRGAIKTTVYRLYKDIGTSGKQRASGAFIAMERV